MSLTELTKVTGPGIHTLSNVLSHNIKSSGIITATKFSGPLDSIGGNFAGVITATNGVFSGNISAVDGNFSGNVTIGGTLTYEDVTNIDSVGIITAQKDIHVGAGVSAVGVGTFGQIKVGTGITIGTAGVGTFTSVQAIDSFACQKYPTTKISFPTNQDHLQIFTSNTQRMRFYAAGTIFIGEESQGPSGNAGLYLNRSSTSVFSDSSRLYDQPNYAMVHIKNYNATGGGEAGIVLHNDNGAAGVVAIYGKKRSNYISDCIFRFRDAGNTSVESFRVRTTDIQVGTGVTIETNGQATFVGIVTFGSSSTTINGNTDTVNVGTALTIGHSQGLQYHTQNLHAQGFEVNQINASGIITATTFSGSGASLTNLNGSNIASGTVPVARIGTGTKSTSTFYRGDGTFATVTSTTINSNADNRLITGSGTANTLNGESTLTYDGTTFTIGSGKNMVMYGPSGTSYSLSVEPIVSTPYGIRVKEPSTVSNGYPLIVASTNSGATLFRVLSGTGVAETRTMQPVTNNTYDLGTSSKRYANIYTQDLQLSNEAVGDNGIDGTWGNYTIVEGESDLFLKNNRSGKTYKFNLTEVS